VSIRTRQVDIRPSDPTRRVEYLSGGNQQKVVLAKWLTAEAAIYIFDEPTRGIDVGAKTEIYRLMGELAAAGKGVIMISSDIPEILGICDRILVLHLGKPAAEFSKDDATSERILNAAMIGQIQA
jgi:ABC-type sugar transport system ATPase subunit